MPSSFTHEQSRFVASSSSSSASASASASTSTSTSASNAHHQKLWDFLNAVSPSVLLSILSYLPYQNRHLVWLVLNPSQRLSALNTSISAHSSHAHHQNHDTNNNDHGSCSRISGGSGSGSGNSSSAAFLNQISAFLSSSNSEYVLLCPEEALVVAAEHAFYFPLLAPLKFHCRVVPVHAIHAVAFRKRDANLVDFLINRVTAAKVNWALHCPQQLLHQTAQHGALQLSASVPMGVSDTVPVSASSLLAPLSSSSAPSSCSTLADPPAGPASASSSSASSSSLSSSSSAERRSTSPTAGNNEDHGATTTTMSTSTANNGAISNNHSESWSPRNACEYILEILPASAIQVPIGRYYAWIQSIFSTIPACLAVFHASLHNPHNAISLKYWGLKFLKHSVMADDAQALELAFPVLGDRSMISELLADCMRAGSSSVFPLLCIKSGDQDGMMNTETRKRSLWLQAIRGCFHRSFSMLEVALGPPPNSIASEPMIHDSLNEMLFGVSLNWSDIAALKATVLLMQKYNLLDSMRDVALAGRSCVLDVFLDWSTRFIRAGDFVRWGQLVSSLVSNALTADFVLQALSQLSNSGREMLQRDTGLLLVVVQRGFVSLLSWLFDGYFEVLTELSPLLFRLAVTQDSDSAIPIIGYLKDHVYPFPMVTFDVRRDRLWLLPRLFAASAETNSSYFSFMLSHISDDDQSLFAANDEQEPVDPRQLVQFWVPEDFRSSSLTNPPFVQAILAFHLSRGSVDPVFISLLKEAYIRRAFIARSPVAAVREYFADGTFEDIREWLDSSVLNSAHPEMIRYLLELFCEMAARQPEDIVLPFLMRFFQRVESNTLNSIEIVERVFDRIVSSPGFMTNQTLFEALCSNLSPRGIQLLLKRGVIHSLEDLQLTVEDVAFAFRDFLVNCWTLEEGGTTGMPRKHMDLTEYTMQLSMFRDMLKIAARADPQQFLDHSSKLFFDAERFSRFRALRMLFEVDERLIPDLAKCTLSIPTSAAHSFATSYAAATNGYMAPLVPFASFAHSSHNTAAPGPSAAAAAAFGSCGSVPEPTSSVPSALSSASSNNGMVLVHPESSNSFSISGMHSPISQDALLHFP
eukprot:ANDGO_01216.mRNA.1 hypothetical protein